MDLLENVYEEQNWKRVNEPCNKNGGVKIVKVLNGVQKLNEWEKRKKPTFLNIFLK